MTLKAEQVRVIVDTREQTPWDLSPLVMVPGTLRSGDYALEANPLACAVERKSVPDFLACIGRERERFEHELHRLQGYEARAVIVEGALADLHNYPRTQLQPSHINGAIAAWSARFISIVLAGDREQAQDIARRFLFCEATRLYKQAVAFQKGE